MALNIGELTGFLDLDAGPFESGIGKAFAMLGDKKWQVMGAAAGVTAATALAGGLLKAASAEDAVNKLSAQLGLTKDESAKAGKIAGELYANNYGESMEDVTEATGAVMSSIKGMRTASEADVVALTGQLMSLASAMEIDVSRAAQVAGQMVTTGLAKDGVEAADLLTVALQKVPAAIREDILDATDEYGPFFAQLGISGETAMDLLVKSSEKGMFGIDKTGDALKEFTIRSTDMSKASGEAYAALGLSQEEMTKSILAGGDQAEVAFGKIIMGLSGMKDPAAQSQAALALFGTPLEDLGTNEIPKFIDSLANMGSEGFGSVTGAAAEMDATLNGGAGAALKTFTRTAEQTLSDLGAAALPILTPILQNLSEWAPVVGPLVLALGAFGVAIWAVSAGMSAFAAVKGIINAIKIWTAAQWGLNIAMSANVISLIILGVIALIAIIVALVMNWDEVVGFLKGVWGGFVSWFTGIMDGFFGWWNGVWGTFFSNTKGMISDFTANTLGMFRDWGSNTIGMFRDFFSNTLGMFVDFFMKTAGMAAGFFVKLAAPFLLGFQVLKVIFSTGWEILQTYVATILAVMIALVTGQWDKIPAYFVSAFQKIAGFFMAGLAQIDAILGGAITTMVVGAILIWQGLVDWVQSIPQKFMDGLIALAGLGITFGLWILSVKDAAVAKFMELVAWTMGVPAMILNGLIALAQLHIQMGLWILSVRDAAVNRFNETVNWVRGVPGMILNALLAIAQIHVQMGQWIGSVKDAAVNKFLELVAWTMGVPGRIVGALGNLGSLLVGAGGQIIQGFLSGLQAGFENVKSFVGGIGQWIADHKGPKAYDLALLVPAGGWIMTGLTRGLEAFMPSLGRKLNDISWMIQNGIDPELGINGSYAFSGTGAVPNDSSTATVPTVVAVLSEEDRALLRQAADRPINASIKVGQRDFALAVGDADKFKNRR